jgi:iron-sulfur cluster assembly accessory protein
MQDTIHRQMTIEQILGMFPNKAQKLSQEITNAGLHCVGCHAATWETLEAGMYGHGKKDEEIERLLSRLNKLLKEPDSDPDTITLTKKAAEKFIQFAKEDGKEGWAIRFGDRMGGCSGFEYILDFSDKAEADDEIFESEGIKIHVNKGSAKRLRGAEIDYVDGLTAGFKITNRNARSSCGCGHSHNY